MKLPRNLTALSYFQLLILDFLPYYDCDVLHIHLLLLYVAPFDNHWSLGKNEYSPTGCYWFLEVAVKSFVEIPVTQE